jgi:hypothetical protein
MEKEWGQKRNHHGGLEWLEESLLWPLSADRG